MVSIIVIGDFNLHDVSWTPDDDDDNVFLPHTVMDSSMTQNRSKYQVEALDFLDKMMSLPLCQLSNIRNRASNVLDLVFVNTPNEFRLTKDSHTIVEETQQDPSHVPYEISVEFSTATATQTENVTVYQYRRGHYERMAYPGMHVKFW